MAALGAGDEARSHHFFDAVEHFRIAVAHAPGEARYHAALGRSLALTAAAQR